MSLYLTVVTGALGDFYLQDPFPAEGLFSVHIDPSTTKVIPVSTAQLEHLREQLDTAVEEGIVTSYVFDDTDKVPSDEFLEIKNRTAKVVTLAVTGGTVPNLVTLGVRKGDLFNKYVALTGVTTSYEVVTVHSATIFEAATVVVAFDILAAGDTISFTRDGVLITGTDRTVAGAITHLIATVSQSPYYRAGVGRFFFKASDGKPYALSAAGVEYSLGMIGSDPLVDKGNITVAADFPLVAAVKPGWVYKVLADVTDNAGATYTNTGQSFLAKTEIEWNGTNWTELGLQVVVQKAVATPVVIPAGNSVNFVDTSTIGAAIAAALPAVTAKDVGTTIAIGDCSGDNVAHNITITPNGTNTIDGVNAPLVLNQDYVMVTLECVAAGEWKTVQACLSSTAFLAAVVKLAGIEAAADVTDATNVAAAGAAMRTGMTAVGDIITAASVGPVVQGKIVAGAAGTVLVGNGVGVVPSFQAVAGLAADVLDAVVAVADSASGVATTTGTVQINDLAGAPIAHAVEGLLLAQSAQYGGRNAIQAHVTFSLATAGSILASGAGWCVFKTSAAGLFACTLTNANDEGVYFSVTGVDGGVDALAAGAIIRGCIPDLATWIA